MWVEREERPREKRRIREVGGIHGTRDQFGELRISVRFNRSE